ncbi:ribbon-helix-helix domain-containing protein [Halorubrum ezzemoulense]
MTTVRLQVCLPPQLAAKIDESVESGHYNSASEAIRHAVREFHGGDE